ncbi:MAG: double-strand break repair protein AddB [Gemmobacter sp.]
MDSPLFPDPGPRIWAMPPGADFPAHLVTGLRAMLAPHPPEAAAHLTLIVNTERMRRRIVALWSAQPGLLPRIRLVTDLGRDTVLPGLPPAVPKLRRRLEVAQLVGGLLDRAPDIGPRAARHDLAESLAALLDEMQGEGVPPARIAALDVSDHSAHWQRTQAFLGIVAPLFADPAAPDAEARQRAVVDRLAAAWSTAPPPGPVIVAGSTGSRGTTQGLMQAVAALPQGALVLPGFDFDLPIPVWQGMDDALTAEDHPQYRFRRLLSVLDLTRDDVRPWPGAAAPVPARNRLVSLSLRPAPVTDQWQTEGAGLRGIAEATAGMTLIEAPSPSAEALAIALILRQAAEGDRVAALVTPDRLLARQVTAALDRWRIRPDDSAGRPLDLSAPGRLLRQTAEGMGARLPSEGLVALLKHPLVAGGGARGSHLRLTRALELHLRRHGPPKPAPQALAAWAAARPEEGAAAWGQWAAAALSTMATAGVEPLEAHVARHRAVTEALAAGPGTSGSGALWHEDAGAGALAVIDDLTREAGSGGTMGPGDYAVLLGSLLSAGQVRDTAPVHPRIRIWGTLEARVQGADLVVLGGLNEGVWPERPGPDPWLNRAMRAAAGLLLPERSIGLAAHDYQQAIAAREVVLTRAARDAEAETVPSRWLNRLTNLLGGLPDAGGDRALQDMRRRGADWLALAEGAERPLVTMPPAPRPAPRPPVQVRPRDLWVTQITTLLRDPYAIYAGHILRLDRLDPLRPLPDARLRGTVLHRVLECFVRERPDREDPAAAALRFHDVARALLAEAVPWPAARALWQARLDRAAAFFLRVDAGGGVPVVVERGGATPVAPFDVTLKARPDRIDRLPNGQVHIYDYKTGSPPSKAQQRHFDKQLLLTAAMAQRGAFKALDGPASVALVSYVGLGAKPKVESTDLTPEDIADVWDGLVHLVGEYMARTKGYASRRAVFGAAFPGDYDHLARFGEWDMTDTATPEDVG